MSSLNWLSLLAFAIIFLIAKKTISHLSLGVLIKRRADFKKNMHAPSKLMHQPKKTLGGINLNLWMDTYTWISKLPLIGAIVQEQVRAQIFLLLSTLLKSRHNLSYSLEVVANSFEQASIREALQKIHKLIQSGMGVALAFNQSKVFTPSSIAMIRVAEQSNHLASTFESLFRSHQYQLGQRIAKLKRWLEPMLLILVAALVALVIIGLYLPIFQIGAVL